MDKELRVKIKIDSETAKLDTLNSKINNTSKNFNNADSIASSFTSKLDALNGKINNTSKNFNNADSMASSFTSKLDALNGKVNTLENSFNKTDSMVSSYTKRILILGGAYLTLNAAIDGGKSYVHQADSMKLLDARLKLATSSTAEYTSQQKELTRISLDTYTTIKDTTTLFTKLNPALKQVGASTEQVDIIVKSFTEGLQLGGAETAETSSAILQFSQAMGSGTLRGEEFNAMADASPKLMAYMAKGLGVPQTALRKMAEEGELTAVKVSNALLSVKSDIDRDFKTMPVTVDKAMTDLSTYMNLGIKDIDNATGASAALSGAILDFGKSIGDISGSVVTFYEDAVNFTKNHNEALDTTGTILKTVTAAYLGFAVTSGIATGIGAITASVYALRTSILLLETSIPVIGWVAAAVGTAAGAYVLANDMMDESNNRASMGITELKTKIEELQNRRDSLAQNKYTDSNTKTINAEIEVLQSKLRIQEKIKQNEIRSSNLIPKEEGTSLTKLIGEYSDVGLEYSKTVDSIAGKKKTFEEFTKEIQKQIDPVRAIHEEYAKLRKDIKGSEADTPEYNKKINEDESKAIADVNKKEREELKKTQDEIDKTNKALLDIKKIGMSEYESGLISITEKLNEWEKAGVKGNDLLDAEIKLRTELNKKTLFESQKEDLSYYERKVQLVGDSISKELELQGIAYANKILEIENSTKSITEKDKLIAKENELFSLTVQNANYKYNTDFQDTMTSFYDDMLDSQLALNNAVYDFGSGFDGVSSKIGAVSKSLAAMSSLELTNKKEASKLDKKYIEQFNKYAGDVGKTGELAKQYEIDTAILKEQNIQAQINGYANIAGAMSGMFAQGSRDAAAFQVVESGLALVAGVRAVISQGSGDPYTAFARMAAMAATISSLLGSIGVAFGMNKNTTTSDAFSSMTANNGSGSILGDNQASTKSITNALSTLEDFAKPEYQTLLSMNNYLETIASNIGGVTSLLIQSGGFAFGDGYSGFDTGYKNNIGLNTDLAAIGGGAGILAGAGAMGGFGAIGGLSVLGPAALGVMALDKLLLGGALTNVVGGVVNTVLGGLFGKTSVSQSLTDSGIYFADTLLTSAIDEFNGQSYQTISTTVSKKSWFSKSSSTSIASYFDELDNETERQFSLVLDNLYSTVLLSGTALDSATVDTAKYLEDFVVSIGKISLLGKTGDQIQETLTSIFGEIGDDLAKTAFPALTPFQQVGEGMFETLTRVATGMETAEYYIGRLGNKFTDITYQAIGNKQGNVGFEALLQSIEKVEKSTYPLNNNLLDVIDNLDATAEELYSVYTGLDELRDRLIYIGQSAEGISSSMIYGAGSADALAEGFNAFFENFLSENEQLTYKTQQLIKNFNDLGVALPVSKDSFKALLSGLDLTSSAGQELYGRLITLSEGFADVADSTASSISDLTTSLTELSTNSFDTFISSLDSVGQSITAIKQTALGFINGFTNSSTASLKDQIISYNKLRDQFGTYFDSNGIIKAGVNKDTISGLYSQITSLASNISGKDEYLKNSLISQVSSDLIKFNSAEDILKVNIVDGLGSLLGLNSSQLAQLQSVVSDGKITNTELSTINGLTQTQKDGIIKFASNSTYFSTEDTLSSLNEYAKKQLEVLQVTQGNETANLSSQTLAYGDYIGKQEQIDIATKLGVSYDSAKPLVEKLQALSISKNPTADIQSMLGFNGEDFTNLTALSQMKSLAQYSSVDILGTINNLSASGQEKKSTRLAQELADKNRLNALIEQAQIGFSREKTDAINASSNFFSFWKSISSEQNPSFIPQNIENGIPFQVTGSPGINEKNVGMWMEAINSQYPIYMQQFNEAANAYQVYQNLLKEKALKGFAIGGYTGDMPVNAIAGFVHGGEHVLDSNITSQINSIGSVADMVNQYTNTNFYEKMNSTFVSMGNKISDLVNITIAQANELKKLRKEVEIDMNNLSVLTSQQTVEIKKLGGAI